MMGLFQFSFGAGAGQDDGDGTPKNLHVQPQGPVVDIFQVQPDPIAEIAHVVAAADLPQAGQSRLDAQPSAVGDVMEEFDFIDREWPRADEAHLATEHVEKLRDFVDAKLAQVLSDRGDARVLGDLENRAGHLIHGGQFVLELFGIGDHGAELVDREGLAIEPGTPLPEEHWAGRGQLDGQSHQAEWHRDQNKSKQRADVIYHTLEYALPGNLRCRREDQNRPAVEIVQTGARNLRPKKIGD